MCKQMDMYMYYVHTACACIRCDMHVVHVAASLQLNECGCSVYEGERGEREREREKEGKKEGRREGIHSTTKCKK